MTAKLKTLTNFGLSKFRTEIGKLRETPETSLKDTVLKIPGTTETVRSGTTLPIPSDIAKSEYGRLLADAIGPDFDAIANVGVWSWIALQHFDQLNPIKDNGERVSYDPDRFILNTPRSPYRHLAWQCWWAMSSFGDNGAFLLDPPKPSANPLSYQGGEIMGQLGANQLTTANEGMVSFAIRLFAEPGTTRRKKNVSGTTTSVSVRDFVRVSQQFNLTFDLKVMDVDQLLSLYPERYRQLAGVAA